MDAVFLHLYRERLFARRGRRQRHARDAQRGWEPPLFLGGNAGERSLMAGLASDLVENAKNVGIVLTSASAASYASGYLALRSRAHALGTDPGFTLLDQAYVFAGFRFTLSTLVAL